MASPGLKRRSLSKPVTASTSSSRAFYELPEDKPTAVQIVRESRDWLQAVSTRRPYTPKDQSRSLFGSGYKPTSTRPLSAIKLSAQSSDLSDSTKNRFSDSANGANYGTDRPAGTESALTQDIRRVRLLHGQGRGKVLKRFTFVEETLPLPNVPREVHRNDFKNLTGLSSGRVPNKPNVAKLELIGTQSKLLSHEKPKLLTPSLSVMSTHGIAGGVRQVTEKEEQSIQRAKPNVDTVIKRGSKSGQTRQCHQSPTTSPDSTVPSSASKKLISTNSHRSDVDTGSRLLSASKRKPWAQSDNSLLENYRKITQSELYQHKDQGPQVDVAEISVHCDDNPEEADNVFSAADRLPFLKTTTLEWMEKPVSGGSQRKQVQLIQNANLTMASDDSRLSSGGELDHLIARLIELSQQLHSFKAVELQLDFEEPDLAPETGSIRASTGNFNEAEEQAEQQMISLLDRTHCVLRESGLAGKHGCSNRAVLLQALFGLLDRSSPRLHLSLARVILTIQVSGTNLANICKLLYKVAKEANNDALFLEHPDTLSCLIDTVQLLDNVQLLAKTNSIESADLMLENCDALLFLTGTLKFLAESPIVAKSLHNHPALLVGLFSVHQHVHEQIRWIQSFENGSIIADPKQHDVEERIYLVLVQISEIFCNLARNPVLRAQMVSASGGVMDHVIDCLVFHTTKPPEPTKCIPNSNAYYLVQFNWIRLLARLTEYTEVCLRLESWTNKSTQSYEDFSMGDFRAQTNCTISDSVINVAPRVAALCGTLISMIETYSADTALIIRIAYLLGNLTARLDSAREALFPNAKALAHMCALCRLHHHAMELGDKTNARSSIQSRKEPIDAWFTNSACSNEETSLETERQPYTEVVNKLVRVLANAAIGETVGQLAVADTECISLFLNLILHECPWRPSELLVNCLAGLNNITYYIHAGAKPNVLAKQYDVAEVLLQILRGGTAHSDVLLGVIRVFGNLTRQASVRDWIARYAGQLMLDGAKAAIAAQPRVLWPNTVSEDQILLYMLIQNLDSARPELVYSTLGVLINLMTDIDQRPAFRHLGGITKLVDVLRDFAGHDWQLAGLACKTLWNYTETPVESIRSLMDVETLNELYNLLSEFTDQDNVDRIHHQSFSEQDSETEQDSVKLWRAAWSSEFFPVASEFLSRLAHC